MSEYAVYLLLVTQAADPDLAAVVEGDVVLMYDEVVTLGSDGLLQPRQMGLVKNRATVVLQAEPADQMAAQPAY